MIRRGDINDAALLKNLGSKTFNDTFGNTCTKEDMREFLELYFNLAQCALELADDHDNFFFFEEEGITKGYMRINAKHTCPLQPFQNRKCIELVRLYVLQEFHGKGVANELMNFAFDFARQYGFDTMYLSVWEYNFRARGFYEKHGFVNSGVENDFPVGSTPQTDYWFVKEL
ncbi:MAG: GNAT family N-acetyltransferase [Bacteroidetes bacterium]|nr:GNAT family N-acetyltransferase [Bacteroidota bacterium]